MRLRWLAFMAVVAGLLSTGCTPQRWGEDVVAGLDDDSITRYSARCRGRSFNHTVALGRSGYVPAQLEVRAGGEWGAEGGTITEDSLADALASGGLRLAIVEGRAGLGKSRLVASLEAQLCRQLPVFRLDAREDLLPWVSGPVKSDKPVFWAVARSLGLYRDAEIRGLRRTLAGSWILLVDSLADVPGASRRTIIERLRAISVEKGGTARVVAFARAPFFAQEGELTGVERRLAMRALDCATARERVTHILHYEEAIATFWERAGGLGLDRTRKEAGRCTFPHLSTYRDVQLAVDTVTALEGEATLTPTRAGIMRRWIAARLGERELVDRPMAQVLEIVDEMVKTMDPTNPGRPVNFEREVCMHTVVGDALDVCTGLLLSGLFRPVRGTEIWRFENRSLMDYFLARWADDLMGSGSRTDCTHLKDIAGRLEAHELSSYLAGMPNGGRCVGTIAEALCAQGAEPEDTAELLDQGIETGPARDEALQPWRDASNPCMRSVIERLELSPRARPQ